MKQVLIIVILIAVVAAIYIFGNPITNEIGKVDISTAPKPISMTDRGFYQIYYPENYEDVSIKRMVLVIQPDGSYLPYITYWQEQADIHGFALAGIENWTGELITQFNIDAREKLGVGKIYLTGFSSGGYASCERGLSNQKYVDGIIPMGAYCSDYDLNDQNQTTPILTIIGAQDNFALDYDLVRPDERVYSYVNKINTEYVIIPNLGHQFPVSYMDEVGWWVIKN